MPSAVKDFRIIAAQKQAQRQGKIPKEWLVDAQKYHDATSLLQVPVTCGILTEVECQITSDYDATALLEKMKGEAWSAEQVTVAFCKRAAIAQQLVSFVRSLSHPDILLTEGMTNATDQLSDRDLLRRGDPTSPHT
jgi:amidase